MVANVRLITTLKPDVAESTEVDAHNLYLREGVQGVLPSPVRFVDTVCQPTKQRQHAAQELAQRCDVVVVIGGANSNNTRELVITCSRHCDRVHHVQTASELRENWFHPEDTVGITAGTSTPDKAIAEVESRLDVLAGSLETPSPQPVGRKQTEPVLLHLAETGQNSMSSLTGFNETRR